MSDTRKIHLIRCLAFAVVLLFTGLGLAQEDHHSTDHHSAEGHENHDETHDESMGDGMQHDDMHHDGMDGDMHGDMHEDGMHHDPMDGDGMGMDHAAHGDEMPADLDLSTLRESENGHFVVSYVTDSESPQLNQLHSWTVHIEDANGEAVEDARVMISGDMPQHGHGLPTEPAVTQNLGNGDYLVEGMRFQMPGWWAVKFMVHAGGKNDSITFNLMAR